MLNVLVVDDSVTLRRVVKNVMTRLVEGGVTFYSGQRRTTGYAKITPADPYPHGL